MRYHTNSEKITHIITTMVLCLSFLLVFPWSLSGAQSLNILPTNDDGFSSPAPNPQKPASIVA